MIPGSSPRELFGASLTRCPSNSRVGVDDDQLRDPVVMRGADYCQPALLSGVCHVVALAAKAT